MSRRNKRREPRLVPIWRLSMVFGLMAALSLLLVGRVMNLQLIDGDQGAGFLNDQADARSIRNETLYGVRGMITDRNGEPLAVSTPVVAVWLHAPGFDAAPGDLKNLAKALSMGEEQLLRRIRKAGSRDFVYLRRQLPPEIGRRVMALDIPGIHLRREYRRYYPAGEAAAHLVGLTDIDQRGQEGLELAYEQQLQAQHGRKRVLRNRHGKTVRELSVGQPAISGENIALSIDLRLQHLAHRELKSALGRYSASSGSVVVLDATTSEVLAIVNQPATNTNDRRGLKPDSMRNRALTDVFEPGSTIKPFTVLAALESGQYNPESVIDTSPGYLLVAGKRYNDPADYGLLDLEGILRKSSQVGTSKLALSLAPHAVANMLAGMGFGVSTQSGFPGERSGSLILRPNPSEVERAALSFGYGVSVTAVQLAQAYAVLANDGYFQPVSLLAGRSAGSGRQVTSPRLATRIRAMLESVTSEEGTGRRAAVRGWSVAGKTGTVHRASKEGRGYDKNSYIALFAGMAPADNPKIVAVVVIHDPGLEHYYGGEVAAPVFARIAAAAMRLLNVPPDPSALALSSKSAAEAAQG